MIPDPTVALTLGDPAGIGPEIIAKAFAQHDLAGRHRMVVLGNENLLRRAADLVGARLQIKTIEDPDEGLYEPGVMNVVEVGELPNDLPFGKLDARAGAAAYAYLERATTLALEGRVGAICTAPLNKEALHLAGLNYPGHTEILANLTGTKDYAMMLVAPDLRVIHVSTHVSLSEAIERATPERELTVIRLARDAMHRIGIEEPRMAIAGLNPHAGENGLFGTEDIEKIKPAITAARKEGIEASGPWSADTVFVRARRGDFDIVVVQYHDQGHVPIKLLGFESGVNVTVGLPFFRTSVDHGTAFDIAGTGKADPASLLVALDLARELSLPQNEEGS